MHARPSGLTIYHGDVVQVDGHRMVLCVGVGRAGDRFGMLVREGLLHGSTAWSSQWSLKPEIQWLWLGNHELQIPALHKRISDTVIETVMR